MRGRMTIERSLERNRKEIAGEGDGLVWVGLRLRQRFERAELGAEEGGGVL